MKRFNLIYTTAMALLIASCSKVQHSEPEPTPPPAPTAQPSLPPRPAATPIPTPVTLHLAPPGVYFTVQRLSATTSDGVRGFPPGTRLALIKDLGDRLQVKAAEFEFEVTPSQITKDLDVAAFAARQDAQAQQAISAYLQQQKAAGEQAVADHAATASQLSAAPGSNIAAPRATPFQSSNEKLQSKGLDGSAYDRHHTRY